MPWFFDPHLSYEENDAHGPFGAFAQPATDATPTAGSHETFVGLPLTRAFGIPAGPLVNARFCAAAFEHGFDLNVYKTVRTRERASHPFPNALAVHVSGDLDAAVADAAPTVLADRDLNHATSISNSFGVPSRDPDVWQPDMAAAVTAAGPGQILVGSFQGTKGSASRTNAYVRDHVTAARLVAETGARVLELNLSCPNEGTSQLLCYDVVTVAHIVALIKEDVGDTPLILKLAYIANPGLLVRLVTETRDIVDAYAAINTLPARLVDPQGRPALPGVGRETAGVCGNAIRWAGLEMVGRLADLREAPGGDYDIVGVGGVMTPPDVVAYRQAGANAVMSATGALLNPGLGRAIHAMPRITDVTEAA